jgi:hypothetical protein
MKIDYSKDTFTQEEKDLMKEESEIIREKNPEYIPILILINSNVLTIVKHKFLIPKNISVISLINTIKKKLIGLQPSDVLTLHIIKFSGSEKRIKLNSTYDDLSVIYETHKDPETDLLVIKISRNTTYKSVKNYVSKFIGW